MKQKPWMCKLTKSNTVEELDITSVTKDDAADEEIVGEQS